MYKFVVRVVAAIFHDEDKIYCAQRAYGEFEGCFEFPGGKIEKGETPLEALKREIKEELGAEIISSSFRQKIRYEYPSFFLEMDVFDAKAPKDSLVFNPKVHKDANFYSKEEAYKLKWCPADQQIISEMPIRDEYPFFNSPLANMKPVNEEYKEIKDVRHLYSLLKECWGPSSCSKRLRDKWSKENMTLAQCNPTSFLVQDIFGGKVLGTPLKNGLTHCFNEVDGIIFDLTSEQFLSETVDYDNSKEQFREPTFLAEPEKKERYLSLKSKLDALLRTK